MKVSTIRVSVVMLALGVVCSSHSIAQTPATRSPACLHYDPHVVRITGILITEPHYGPPNFGETPDQDKKVDVPMLQLAEAVDVCGDPTSAADQDTVRNVRKVQVVGRRINLKAFIGQEVAVTGYLFEAHTANHHTKVLIRAESIRVYDRAPRRL